MTRAERLDLYRAKGAVDREGYVSMLAHEHSLPVLMVRDMALLLGANEDFDGLVTHCEDLAQSGSWQNSPVFG